MVDFHNPHTIAQELGAYALRLTQGSEPNYLAVLLNSDGRKCLAPRGWCIYVSFPSLGLLP